MQIRSLARMRARAPLLPVLGALAFVVLANCAEPPTMPALAPPATPLAGWTTTPPVPSLNTEFQWVKGNNAVWLGPSSDRACFLTKVGGRFDGATEWVGVYLLFGEWYLSGASTGTGWNAVTARARCVAATSYTLEKTATVDPTGPTPSDEFMDQAPLGGGACGLTRIGGKFANVNDAVGVTGSVSGWTLIVISASEDYISAGARCITAPSTERTGGGSWNFPDPIHSLASAGVSAADFCLLTQVHGPFRAIEDWVWLSKDPASWSILGADQSNIGACADCFRKL